MMKALLLSPLLASFRLHSVRLSSPPLHSTQLQASGSLWRLCYHKEAPRLDASCCASARLGSPLLVSSLYLTFRLDSFTSPRFFGGFVDRKTFLVKLHRCSVAVRNPRVIVLSLRQTRHHGETCIS